jgi:HSP20 family protein
MLTSMGPGNKSSIDSFFDSTVSSFLYPQFKNRTYEFGFSKMVIDLLEDGDNFTLKADLPGVLPSEMQIQLEKDCLEIEVSNKKPVQDEEAVKLLINERLNTHMKRSIKLPKPVDSDKAKSSYKDGVLEIVLPKSEKTQIKIIPIT